MIHDITYVVVAINWGMMHVYQINQNLVSTIGLRGALVVLVAAFWHVGHVLQNCYK